MQIEYDQEARAVYVALFEGTHARTIEVEPQSVYAPTLWSWDLSCF
jgi:hypothetical protein